jgi:hypothetical protein
MREETAVRSIPLSSEVTSTVKEVARILKVSAMTVRRLIESGVWRVFVGVLEWHKGLTSCVDRGLSRVNRLP